MPTFVALLCFNCNMMQVKHAKESSNKWTCSLCNEKQSVRKVFATSVAAKDIRKFVQEYNLSRNRAQDRALAELVVYVEKQGNDDFAHDDHLCCSESSRACRDILSYNCNCQEVIVGSKWDEYLPQDDGVYSEVAEYGTHDAEFVTVVPETHARISKGRIPSASNKATSQHGVQQKQRRMAGKPSSRPLESIRECQDAAHKENGLRYACTQKVSLSSSSQLPNLASITNGSAYKVPQQIAVQNMPMQASAAGVQLREREYMPPTLRKPKALTEVKRPASAYTPYLGEEGQKYVSKWAKYMDSDGEVTHSKEAMWNYVGDSSIWSQRAAAASNTHHLDGTLVKTELD
ncbi:hypothetical protein GOP47_0028916 [Adiantum capillus-veneris]|nr:hypothetical protein GOP47_0028916 [Adiantum capillus-veneris]